MLLCPKILLTVSIGTPLLNVIVVAKHRTQEVIQKKQA